MLILASASPRRHDLLTQAGFSFQVHPAHLNEDPHPGEAPSAYVERLAREKAQVVFADLEAIYVPTETGPVNLHVLGADTTVTIDNIILGKPADAADAARMLRLLSGRTHAVITGVALVSQLPSMQPTTESTTQTFTCTTLVTMHPLTEAQIAGYIATGEPMDKAGAYAIQGAAAEFIDRINNEKFSSEKFSGGNLIASVENSDAYSNVVGLPIARVRGMLKKLHRPIDI